MPLVYVLGFILLLYNSPVAGCRNWRWRPPLFATDSQWRILLYLCKTLSCFLISCFKFPDNTVSHQSKLKYSSMLSLFHNTNSISFSLLNNTVCCFHFHIPTFTVKVSSMVFQHFLKRLTLKDSQPLERHNNPIVLL